MADRLAPAPHPSHDSRRSFLFRTIQGVHATIAATLAYILGSAVLAPSLERRESMWLSAADLSGLTEGEPHVVTLRVARRDGATEAVDRRVVFLVRSGDAVKALDSTCTHLGCRTRLNTDARQIECPCHGGVYDLSGQVVSGPPPHALGELPTRIDGTRILVQV
jgi:menaquinol-cytochrome c reductase iron-sulfur subunit